MENHEGGAKAHTFRKVKACLNTDSNARKKGAVSILMVIVIPIFIMGCLLVYQILYQRQVNMRTEKIVLACSDAYLSMYNGYLFDELALLANNKSPGVEVMVREYLIKNKIIDTNVEISFDASYMGLDQPDYFREAIYYASTAQIGRSIVRMGDEWINQLSAIQTLRKVLKSYNTLLDNIADVSKMTGIETTLEMLTTIETNQFLEGIDKLSARCEEEEGKLAAITDQLRLIESQIKGEAAGAKAFVDSQDALVMEALEQARLGIQGIKALVKQVKDQPTLEHEMLWREMVDEQLKDLRSRYQNEETDLLDALKNAIIEAEKVVFSGEETKRKLTLPKPSASYEITEALPKLSSADRWLINEYLLMIFSSYDENCPRNLNTEKRKNINRPLKAEVEYLLTGEVAEANSLSLVRLKMFALREGANLIGIITSQEKMATLTKSTLAIPPPWRQVALATMLGGWATIESYYDVRKLVAGEGLHLIKTPDEWTLSLEQLLEGHLPQYTKQQHTGVKSITDPRLYYQDYLRLLLYFQTDEITLSRTMALMDSELWWASDQKATLEHYAIGFDLHFQVEHPWGDVFDYRMKQAIYPGVPGESVHP